MLLLPAAAAAAVADTATAAVADVAGAIAAVAVQHAADMAAVVCSCCLLLPAAVTCWSSARHRDATCVPQPSTLNLFTYIYHILLFAVHKSFMIYKCHHLLQFDYYGHWPTKH